jgi:hypothetical protein
MGAEFIRRASKSFTKHWDVCRKALATADLFTREPTCAGRSAPFDLAPNVAVQAGDVVIVEREGTALVARRGLREVARAASPPPELLRAVEDSCGVAKGTIEHTHGLANVAEISLC